MDYLVYESFIHPDLLSAFLIKDNDVSLTVKGAHEVNAEVISFVNTDNVFVGDKFINGGIVYTVRAVDSLRNQLHVNPLTTKIADGAILMIQKEDKREALKNFYDIGQKDYATFANSLIETGVPVRFEEDVYVLKRAFIAMYGWILQNKAFLRNLNLSGIGISKSDVYQHFFDLLESEKKDYENIRSEAMDEVKRKLENDANGKIGKGFVRYAVPKRSFFGGYRR